MAGKPDRAQEESRRILKQIDQEIDPSRSLLERSARRARDHMAGADADQNDASELWGTRVGRGLGLVLLAGLIWYLGSMVLGG